MNKLALHKETVRALDERRLQQVAGGGKTNRCGGTDRCIITSTVTLYTCNYTCDVCVDPVETK